MLIHFNNGKDTTSTGRHLFIKCNEEAQKAGLLINVNKTKYKKLSRNQHLGSVINTNNTIEEEIKKESMQGIKHILLTGFFV
jgi:hypothetical protein